MEDIVSRAMFTNADITGPGKIEKTFVLICRFLRKEDKEKRKEGQVYFILTSAEKDRMFKNIIERLREIQNKNVRSDTKDGTN